MSTAKSRAQIAALYAEAARDYLRRHTTEHVMESTAQAAQRTITLESLDLLHARRPEVQVFNELLVQYPRRGYRKLGQVVPDNMVVVCDQPIDANGSFDLPSQPVGPFWVLEYVSKTTERKDYEDNFDKYEKGLKVPYYLLFHPETKDLTLYHHNGKKYVSVPANEHGRHPIPELELEVGLREGWMRYWHRGELLPLPADLQRELEEARRQIDEAAQRTVNLQQKLDEERQARLAAERELELLRAQLKGASGQAPKAP